ncbi:MAG: hypothetical protein WCG98_01065 [bacterium]
MVSSFRCPRKSLLVNFSPFIKHFITLSFHHFIMYSPSETILQKYADVLVNFALRQGNGIKK